MFNKTKSHKALTLGDAVPAIIALALIAIVGAVALLILTSLQANPVTTPSFNGGSGAYGVFIESNSFVNSGNIVANSPAGRAGQATGGGGMIFVIANSYTNTGSYFEAAGTGGDAAGGAGSNTFNLIFGAPPIPFATSATACGNNIASTAAGGCTGNIFYTQSITLTGNINVTGNIVVTNGATLTTNGWDLVAGSNVVIQNTGQITTGADGLGGAGGSQTTNGAFGLGGTLTSNSYGGTGAGGTGCFTVGGYGGNTIKLGAAPGAAGTTCTPGSTGAVSTAIPTGSGALTTANVILYAGGGQANVLIYLSGAGAGGSSPQFSAAYNGVGNGVTGIGTILSFQSLLGLVVVAAIIIGVVVGAFSFGRGSGQSREEF